jgi:hypothetical protein
VNPGRLPIDDVHVHWMFPCDVVRVRHDGIADDPTNVLTLSAPVLVGGGKRAWRRHLLIDYSCKDRLSEIYADVTFNDIEGHRRTNRWPRSKRESLSRGGSASPDRR